MKLTFSQYLIEQEIFEGFVKDIQEENLLGILTALKKKIVALLKEDQEIDDKKMENYLKIVAIFEQFFRFLQAKKVQPSEIVGLKSLIDKNDIEHTDETSLEKGIEKVITSYSTHSMISFKNIVERRFTDFMKWIKEKKKEDLEVVNGAIEFTTKAIEQYHLAPV